MEGCCLAICTMSNIGLMDLGTHTIWEILDQEKEAVSKEFVKLTMLKKTLALIHCWDAFACLPLTT